MLIGVFGLTGVGKSFFVNECASDLNIKKVNTIRTREKREGEEGLFLSNSELDKLKEEGKIIFDFTIFSNRYGYYKDEILSSDNYIFEMYYLHKAEFEKVCKDFVSIYVVPSSIEKCIENIKKRNLSPEKEKIRIEDTIEQYNYYINNKKELDSYDIVFENDFSKESLQKFKDLINSIISKKYFDLGDDFEKIIKRSLGCNLDKFRLDKTGWTNIVYEVECSKGQFYFRFPRDDFWSKTIIKDASFSQFISGKVSIKTSYLNIGYDLGRPFSFHKKIPGHTLASKMDSLTKDEIKNISYEIATFMNELHSLDAKEYVSNDNNSILMNFLYELLFVHIDEKKRAFFNSEINNGDKLCLVHGDFNSSNILLDDNNHMCAVIDFGFAGYGTKYDDIGRIVSRCSDEFGIEITKACKEIYECEIEEDCVQKNSKQWKNIDSAYIEYMLNAGVMGK